MGEVRKGIYRRMTDTPTPGIIAVSSLRALTTQIASFPLVPLSLWRAKCELAGTLLRQRLGRHQELLGEPQCLLQIYHCEPGRFKDPGGDGAIHGHCKPGHL